MIVLYDGVGDGKQRRLIAEVQFPGALFRPELALMLLASFHVHNKSDEEPDHGANSERQADSADQKDFLAHVVS